MPWKAVQGDNGIEQDGDIAKSSPVEREELQKHFPHHQQTLATIFRFLGGTVGQMHEDGQADVGKKPDTLRRRGPVEHGT